MDLKINKKDYIIIIFVVIFFIFGFLFWRYEYLNKYFIKNKSDTWVRILQDVYNIWKNDKNFSWNIDYSLFNEAYSLVINNYYSSNNISPKDVEYWMIKWMVESLKDKHSEFFDPEETKKFNEALSWDFEWIWAVVQKNDFWVIIDRIIAWSPAKESWILAWDIIIKANNDDLKNLTVSEAVMKIRWKAGTVVKLEIIRPWEKENIIKEVTRRKITIPSVDSRLLENDVGYIILSIFWEKSWDEFKEHLDTLYSKNIKALIIDLRDDWGWYLETAVQVLSNFVEKDKVLVTTKEKNPLNNVSYFSRWNINKKIPIVVLINWNSASASEITAWALKDYNIAIIVWEKSYWKWSVQKPFTLSDWSELKVTVAKWYTPSDNIIDWVWIKPDVEVLFKKEDYEKNFDRQLDESKKVLNKIIELGWDIKKTKEFYNIEKQKEIRDKLDKIQSWSTRTWETK